MHEFWKLCEPYTRRSGWELADSFADQVLIAQNLKINVCGFSATKGELAVTGSAGDASADPQTRAICELIERIGISDLSAQKKPLNVSRYDEKKSEQVLSGFFPASNSDTWCYAKSNGFGLHTNLREAARSALFELVERHQVLASWAGLVHPCPQALPREAEGLLASGLYEVRTVNFGQVRALVSQIVHAEEATGICELSVFTSGVFCFPKDSRHPLVYGFGSDVSPDAAAAKALRECLQRLGFLWGEELPVTPPEFSPTPLFHQEFFLFSENHSFLRNWLDGKVMRQYVPTFISKEFRIALFHMSLADLPFKLVCARSDAAIPLVFGKGFKLYQQLLPEDRIIHPIV